MSRPRFHIVLTVVASLFAIAAQNTAVGWQDDEQDVGELMEEAQGHLQAGEFAEAAEVFKKVVELDKENGRAWHLYGYSLHGAGELDEAIKIHTKATEFDRYRGISLYNLGCAYSLKKDADKAFEYLNKAVKAGFGSERLSDFENDSDLDNIRDDTRYTKLIKGMKEDDEDHGDDEQEGEHGDDDDDEDEDVEFDAKKLVGTWTYVSGVRAGEKVDESRFVGDVVVSKDKFTIPSGGDEPFVMSYKLNTESKPVKIDLKIESGPAPEGEALGIIKMSDDKFVFCYDPFGQSRPEKFETSEDNGFFMFKLKRKKEEKKEKEDK